MMSDHVYYCVCCKLNVEYGKAASSTLKPLDAVHQSALRFINLHPLRKGWLAIFGCEMGPILFFLFIYNLCLKYLYII